MFGAAARFVECEHLEPSHLKSIPADAIWELPMGWSNHFFDQAQDIISNWTANPTDSKIQAIILIQNHRGNLDSKSSACWLMGGFVSMYILDIELFINQVFFNNEFLFIYFRQ